MLSSLGTNVLIIKQKFKENRVVIESILAASYFIGIIMWTVHNKKLSFKLLSQAHRSSHLRKLKNSIEVFLKHGPFSSGFDQAAQATAVTKNDPTEYFGKRIMVLKPPISSREKGVLYIMFSELIADIPRLFDMKKLLDDYILVLEPSWSGYCEIGILQYTLFDNEVFVLSAENDDFRFLSQLKSNLVPIRLGPCDWVDPRISEKFLSGKKQFDIVMNSHWGDSKRHYVLFEALKKLPTSLGVALIGVPWRGNNKSVVQQLAKYYRVEQQITFFERIPYEEVMKICCESKLGILLSLKEGSNRALAEIIFCDTPVILLNNHVGGIRKNIVDQTGIITDEKNLPQSISRIVGEYHKFSPRKWAVENISCFASSQKLNDIIRKRTVGQGREWSKDIACRSNSPESRYCYDSDSKMLNDFNHNLRNYLIK